jgi:hypothetical protein
MRTLLRLIRRHRTHTTRIGTRLNTYQINAIIDAGWDYRLPTKYQDTP